MSPWKVPIWGTTCQRRLGHTAVFCSSRLGHCHSFRYAAFCWKVTVNLGADRILNSLQIDTRLAIHEGEDVAQLFLENDNLRRSTAARLRSTAAVSAEVADSGVSPLGL